MRHAHWKNINNTTEETCPSHLVYTNLYKVDCETSSATYTNHSRHLIPDGIHRHEGMREEKPVFVFLLILSAKQGRHWYHFLRLWYDAARVLTRDLPHSKRTLYH